MKAFFGFEPLTQTFDKNETKIYLEHEARSQHLCRGALTFSVDCEVSSVAILSS